MSKDQPETSIIIRAFNEERWLPAVLAALKKQKYQDFELLLVDSGSVDQTREIAAAGGAKIVRLRSEDFTFGHSLNVGITEAHGNFIVILSAHAIPSDENWLELLINALKQTDIAMVYGGQRGHEISKFSEVLDFERIFPSKPRQVLLDDPENPFANNANSAIKRDLWEKHPFDEGLPGLEDIEFAKYWIQRGLKVLYEPDSCIIHVHTESWLQLRNRYHREGMAARWVELRILRDIPGEIWRELRWCTYDLFHAARKFRFFSLIGEILRFRYEKTIGTIAGIIDSRGLDNPARRAELLFRKEYTALVIGGVRQARLEERFVPNLKPGEILVRVSHVGICGTDFEILEGTLGYYQTGMAKYPIVPGHESSGTAVSIGPRVTGINEGDRVVVECIQGCGECKECENDAAIRCEERREVGVIGQDGACAEYLVIRARYTHKIPETVNLAQAALVEPLAVVHKGLRRLGSFSPGDHARRCAVIGAGTIGHLTARVLALRGHSVTIFDRDKGRLSLLDGTALTSQTLENLEQFEWIIEATGDQSVLSILLQESATGATLLLLGFPYKDETFNFESIVAFDRSVIGSVGSNGGDFEAALEILAKIDTSPFLKESYPLDKFEKALKASRSHAVLKVMLNVDKVAL